jgi:predicted PurR-regulated permease PerM
VTALDDQRIEREPDGVRPDSAQVPIGLDAPADATLPLPRRGLLDRDWQKALIVLLTILATVAVLWVIWQIVSRILHTLVLFGLAAVLAFALSGPVDMLNQRLSNRLLAILVTYLLVGILVVGGITVIAGPFVRQATDLAAALPQYANDLQARAPEVQTTLGQYGIQTDIDQLKAQAVSAIEQGGADVLKNLVGTLAEVGGMILDIVLALVISLYLLVDGPRFRERSLDIIPPRHRAKALFLQDNVSRVLGSYLRGQLTLALIIGVLAGVGTALLGLPYAVVLGVLAGLFELVPMFGPILSVVPAVLVALFMPFPTVVWVVLFFLAIQQVENNVLAPRISGHAVGLHPLGAMFALLAGFQLAGLLGGLFAVPLAGVLWVLLGAAYRNVLAEPRPHRPLFPVPRFRRPARRLAPDA